MIHTYIEPGASISESFGRGRKRFWDWVELEPDFPYYLLDFVVEAEDGLLMRQVITDALEEVLVILQKHGRGINVRYVHLISPGHLNGSETTQVKPLAEIWAVEKERFAEVLFVHDDGSTVRFSYSQDHEAGVVSRRRLIADFRRLRS